MPLAVQSFVVSPFAENTYILSDCGECALVDPGTATRGERQLVGSAIDSAGFRVRHLLLTHGHIDHVFGCDHFAHRYAEGADFGGWQLHPADAPLLEQAVVTGEMYGVRVDAPPPATRELAEGDTVEIGSTTLRVLHVPGHSPGSVAFYDEAGGQLISGDALFAGSIGRTDLWQGSMEVLLASIRDKILVLPDDTVVYSGHGPSTTVGAERQSNPFLRDL
ncbi:MAG: MBL fold metallo-hydrolase [Rubricoccaceae bacterium]